MGLGLGLGLRLGLGLGLGLGWWVGVSIPSLASDRAMITTRGVCVARAAFSCATHVAVVAPGTATFVRFRPYLVRVRLRVRLRLRVRIRVRDRVIGLGLGLAYLELSSAPRYVPQPEPLLATLPAATLLPTMTTLHGTIGVGGRGGGGGGESRLASTSVTRLGVGLGLGLG